MTTLFLGGGLGIKRFTSAASQVFRLIGTDVGRPIADIAPRFTEDLLPDMKEVLRTAEPRSHQVHLGDGSATYIVRMLPYRLLDNTLDGLVVTFLDVSQLEAAQEQHARLAAIVASSHDAIVSRAFDGAISSWNEAAARLFGYSEQEAVGKSIFDLIVPPDLRMEIEQTDQVLRRGGGGAPAEAAPPPQDGARIAGLVGAAPLQRGEGRPPG